MRWVLYTGGFVFALAAALLGGAAQAVTLESYMVRDWNIGAYGDDETKEFTHCAMKASYKNGVLLVFGISSTKQWYMNLANDNWTLTEGNKYNFDIELDGRRGKNWFGVALSPTVLNIPLADEASLFELFSAAQTLTIKAESRIYKFDLSNSRVALQAVVDCTDRYLNTNPFKSNPFAKAPKGPGSKVNDEEYYSEGAIVMTNMLSAIGSVGHQLLPVQTIREKYRGYHAVWTGNGASGGLKILPGAHSVSETGSELLAEAAQECDGKFATGKSSEGDDALKIAAICQDRKGQVSNYHYIVTKRENGGVYLFFVTALDEKDDSVNAAARLGDLMLASAKK